MIIIIIIIILLISSPNIEQSSKQHTQQNRTKLNTYIYMYLNIERGRYIKLPVEKRICPLCKIEPEDEIYLILNCSKLDECRKELFSYISSVVPSFNDMDEFQKFKFILSSNDLDICKIQMYVS
jgi:hypothetical protein